MRVGGFFSVDLRNITAPHEFCALDFLNAGRWSLYLILLSNNVKRIYFPKYHCPVIRESLFKANVEVVYYDLTDNLEPKYYPKLKNNEFFYYINYFGVKDRASRYLYKFYRQRFILDNAHSFYFEDISGLIYFNSARKFLGVADGSYCRGIDPDFANIPSSKLVKPKYMSEFDQGNFLNSFHSFREYERTSFSKISLGSDFSLKLINSYDHSNYISRRRENFHKLHLAFYSCNLLDLSSVIDDNSVPYCYPLFLKNDLDFKYYYDRSIYVPKLWDDIHKLEPINFSNRILCLPVDQRISDREIEYIISSVDLDLNP